MRTQVICLTGGIGSGKTTIARFFEEEGIPIYVADDRAKALMDQKLLRDQIQLIFDTSVISPNGQLDRAKIRQLVFDNKTQLHQLNAIVHPAVAADFQNWLALQQSVFVIKESAILFEAQMQSSCDQIILVTAPENVRIERVMLRDGVDRINIENIIKNQMSDCEKSKHSHYIVENIDKKTAKLEVKRIINEILTKSTQS